jgi:hypothetical protein
MHLHGESWNTTPEVSEHSILLVKKSFIINLAGDFKVLP